MSSPYDYTTYEKAKSIALAALERGSRNTDISTVNACAALALAAAEVMKAAK